MLKTADKEVLESLIDAHDLEGVVEALAEICGEKADHLRSNWQDEAAAREWDRDARALDKVQAHLCH